MTWTFLVFAALAADPSTYALRAAAELPPAGVARIALPPELVRGDAERLGTSLLLADATGRAVPYGVLISSRSGPAETVDVAFRPEDASVWEIDASEAPVDALVLDVIDLESVGPVAARVAWDGGSAEALLWDVGEDENRTVEIPHVAGPFTVTLGGWSTTRSRLGNVAAYRNAPDHVPPNVERLALPEPVLTETGSARYVLHLGGVRSLRSLRFALADGTDVFDRDVSVRVPTTDPYVNSYGNGRVRRLKIGSASVDRMEVPIPGMVGDTLVIEVPLERGATPPLTAVDVVSEGAWVVARDAGPGPHVLYGGASVTDSLYDVAIALPELLREPSPLLALAAVEPNPGFVPAATREGIDGAGPDLGLARFAYERPVEGSGWVRLRLGRDVLARTRPDVADVRVVDAEGRQLPFLAFDADEEEPWPVGDFERREEGGSTLLRVPLDGGAPVASIQLTTSRGVFERTVTVLRDAGRFTVPIRQVIWNGPERGSTLAIELGERVGDSLLVRIDNGDDGPLPIERVAVGSPVWELRFRVPEGGARLVYGAPGASAPDYDLSLLRAEIATMPVTDATLGAERALTPPSASVVDKAATLAGVGMLAIGLLGMVLRTLRGVPAKAEG